MKYTQSDTALKIGELSAASGVSVRAIRHYDGQGLLASTRGDNGYRVFPRAALSQVRQIQRLIGAGFSLQDIRGFPDCMRLIEGSQACSETLELQRLRLATLDRQIAELGRRRARLHSMLVEAGETA